MSSTPRLDALEAWLAAGSVGPIPQPRQPVDWGALTPSQRITATIAACASGAPLATAWRRIIVDAQGRRIPPPPTRSTMSRRRKPR